MSDMEQSDVVEPEPVAEAPAAPEPVEPVAPEAAEQAATIVAEQRSEEQAIAAVAAHAAAMKTAPAEPTAEELQAEIDELKASIVAQFDPPTPAPDPVPVITRTPSSEAQKPEHVEEAPEAPLSLADAARVLLIYVKAHRTAGDSDLEAAVADVEAALAS